ncbi:MAG: DUF1572 family protein [Saprospiraceae bacterium]
MLLNTIQQLFTRDLEKLRDEIQSYKNEDLIWHTEKAITNPAGNLVLHLVGNLNAFIGATLGHTGYVRNRDLEFSTKGVSRKELIHKIDDTIKMIEDVMPTLQSLDVNELFPVLVFKEKTSIEYFLIHLVGHIDYHLGQVNYHRRLLDI